MNGLKNSIRMELKSKTTVYSCSGCSNVAQLANKIAVKLDREQLATMSCIAGVGGDVLPLLNQARKAQKILVLDGCQLACAFNCLKRHEISVDNHLILTDFQLSKSMHSDFSEEEFLLNYELIKKLV